MVRSLSLLVSCVLAGWVAGGCRKEGCLGGDDGRCVPAAACPAARGPACVAPAGALRIGRVARDGWTSVRAAGPKAMAAEGDYVLENGRVRLVIDAPEHPAGLAPSGGSVIDLAPLGPDGGDQLNGVFQGAGLLPRDAVRYTSAQVLDGSPAFVAVVVRGHLDGDARVTVVTRYELRPCEPGVRIRTELWNGSRETHTFGLTDGYFWGDRTLLPFVPLRGQGFRHPELDLLKLGQAWRRWPFLAARAQAAPFVAYAAVPCGEDGGEGFNDPTLSASGVPRAPTLPGDAVALERFLLVAPGVGLSSAVDEALRLRSELHGDAPAVPVRGRLVTGGGAPVDGRTGRVASVLFYEPAPGPDPDDPAGRRPWSEAAPDAEGRFTLALPPGRRLRAQPHAFGLPAGPARAFETGGAETPVDLGDLAIERPARLQITVADGDRRKAEHAEVVLVPVVPRAEGPRPSLHGLFGGCDPMLGPPHGASPACNRALVTEGLADLRVPAGRYFVYATRGPFATLAREEVTLAPGDDRALTLQVDPLPLLPRGTLAADFHVHGAGSYDSSLPAIDRVLSFLAAGVDVIAATDHDVVTDYADVVSLLGVQDRFIVLPGVETTPNILYFDVPGETFPKVLGHFNFWPLRHDPFLPRGGAPWDELIEPGALMDAVEAAWRLPGDGVRQMNHPLTGAKLGRDQGFLRAIGYDPRRPVVEGAGFAAEVLLRRPAGGRRNVDFDAQEVVSGASRREWMRNRQAWFAFLSEGLLRAGTANSDTHSFAVEQAGYGRTLVVGPHDVSRFDVVAFNADVRGGRLVGTNGPVLEARLVSPSSGAAQGPSLTAVAPATDSVVQVTVTAVPWIPVTEVRFVLNGRVVKTVPVPLGDGAEPFGRQRVAEIALPLAELTAGVPGDAWLVVEAGLPLPLAADLDDDGILDTLDNDGNGVVDARDAPDDDDDVRFPDPPRPAPGDPRFHLDAIAPGVWPYAFTNPFVLDLDGGGWRAPAR